MLKPNLIYARVAKCVSVAVFAVAMSGCAQRELMNDDISKMSVLRDNSGGLGLQTLHKRGAFRSHKGSSATYSGSVKVTPLFKTTQWREFSGNLVEFDKGGRTAWHSHPQGQTIIVKIFPHSLLSQTSSRQQGHMIDIVIEDDDRHANYSPQYSPQDIRNQQCAHLLHQERRCPL